MNEYKVSTTGKRLVHGDVCANVNKIIPDTDGKGHHPDGTPAKPQPKQHHSAMGGFLLFVIISAFIACIAAVWYRFMAPESAKAQVLDAITVVKSFIVSLVGLISDKVFALLGRRGAGPTAAARYEPLDAELNYFQPLAEAPDDDFGMQLRPRAASDNGGVFTLK